jgi:chromosomal replication initiator protein
MTPSEILSAVAHATGYTIDEINAKRRGKDEVVAVKQLYCYIAKKVTTASLTEIGMTLNGKDHTTVIHSIRVISDFIDVKDSMTMQNLKAVCNKYPEIRAVLIPDAPVKKKYSGEYCNPPKLMVVNY